MQNMKYMLCGLALGMVIGASSTMIQNKVQKACDCGCAVKEKIKSIDGQDIVDAFNDKIYELRNSIYEIKENLTGEVNSKISELIDQIEMLFKEIKQSL